MTKLWWWSASTFAIAACSVTPAGDDPRRATERTPDEPIIRDGGVDSRPDPDSGLGILAFLPASIYSGFDAQHTFRAPIAVYDAADDLQVTTDSSAATITPVVLTNIPPGKTDSGRYFFVTVKKPGTITIVATSRGVSTDATLVVTAYGADRWATGKKRYETAGTNGEPPCAQCHANGAAIDHSPAALAAVTDQDVGLVLTTGISPAGYPIDVDHPSGHRWTLSDAEREGLITYLRGLEPRGFAPR